MESESLAPMTTGPPDVDFGEEDELVNLQPRIEGPRTDPTRSHFRRCGWRLGPPGVVLSITLLLMFPKVTDMGAGEARDATDFQRSPQHPPDTVPVLPLEDELDGMVDLFAVNNTTSSTTSTTSSSSTSTSSSSTSTSSSSSSTSTTTSSSSSTSSSTTTSSTTSSSTSTTTSSSSTSSSSTTVIRFIPSPQPDVALGAALGSTLGAALAVSLGVGLGLSSGFAIYFALGSMTLSVPDAGSFSQNANSLNAVKRSLAKMAGEDVDPSAVTLTLPCVGAAAASFAARGGPLRRRLQDALAICFEIRVPGEETSTQVCRRLSDITAGEADRFLGNELGPGGGARVINWTAQPNPVASNPNLNMGTPREFDPTRSGISLG